MSTPAVKPDLVEIPAAEIARVQQLAELEIRTPEQERGAIDGLTFLQTLRRNLEQARTELVKPLNDQVRRINDWFRPHGEAIDRAERRVKAALSTWREAERRRLEEERQRIDAENRERQRQADEEAARRRAELEAETKAQAQAAGFAEPEADELAKLEAASVQAVEAVRVAVPPPPPSTARASMGSVTYRKVWKAQVVNLRALAGAIAAGTQPETLIAPNMVAINALRPRGDAPPPTVPGVRFYQEEDVAGRRLG